MCIVHTYVNHVNHILCNTVPEAPLWGELGQTKLCRGESAPYRSIHTAAHLVALIIPKFSPTPLPALATLSTEAGQSSMPGLCFCRPGTNQHAEPCLKDYTNRTHFNCSLPSLPPPLPLSIFPSWSLLSLPPPLFFQLPGNGTKGEN